jgi:hypothetical protein
VPIPYPNIAKSSDTSKGAKQVTCDGNPPCVKDSNFMMSTGDEAGTLMGMVSSKIKGKAEFVNFSFDVQIEGKNVPRAMDMMLHNDKNTPPVPVMQGPVIAMWPIKMVKPIERRTFTTRSPGFGSTIQGTNCLTSGIRLFISGTREPPQERSIRAWPCTHFVASLHQNLLRES